jgi:glycine cleavage system aminomethyltransferase T
VTSPIVSPLLGAIGLAVLRADAAIEGEKVEVGGSVAAVGPLSLFDPQKTRPRG